MYSYTAAQWLLFFYIYCFIGWCLESTYVSLKSHRLVNRGFIRGPFLPLYGFGAILMLLAAGPFRTNPFLMFFSGMICATALEYVTGVCMEFLFKVRYWDYSKKRFNFQGHICLSSSLAWGALTLALNYVIHKPVEYLVLLFSPVILRVLVSVLTLIIGADFITSFKTAMELRKDLEGITSTKADLYSIQKRMDALFTKAGLSLAQKKTDLQAYAEQLPITARLQSISEKLDTIKERADEVADDLRSDFADLKIRLDVIIQKQKQFQKRMTFFKRDMINSNPDLTSRRYKAELDYLKTYLAQQSGRHNPHRKKKHQPHGKRSSSEKKK